MAKKEKELTAEKATGIRNPVPWLAGAILGPQLISQIGGGNPIITLGLPLAAAVKGEGGTKAAGQGASTMIALSMLGPMLGQLVGESGLGGLLGGGQGNANGSNPFAVA